MRILITTGGTREYIDPVRFISNASSGRMGYALARAAHKAGHKVTLIAAPTLLIIPDGVRAVRVETAAEMFEAVKKHFEKCECLIMAAAVADYTPRRKSKIKIKKSVSSLTIKLKPTVDILKWAGRHKRDKSKKRIIVGFALEDRNLRKNAERKLKEKNLDVIVANKPEAIGGEKSAVCIKVYDGPWQEFTGIKKDVTARRIIKLVEAIRP